MEKEFDLIIIGGGSAAFAAASRANTLELKTLVINGELPIGGTCVNVGCVPSKFLIRAAESIYYASHSSFEGITPKGVDFDFKKIIQQKKQLVARMQKEKYSDLLKDFEFVSFLEGIAEFTDEKAVRVGEQEFKGHKIIIATGSSTLIPKIKGLENIPYFTNDTLFDLEDKPESLIIIGGGYIGLEIAQAYSRFGTKVTILEAGDTILSTETKDVTDELAKQLESEEIKIITKASAKEILKDDQIITVVFEKDNKEQKITTSHLLIATGRKANTEKLKLENAGIEKTKKGFIKVNNKLKTNISSIYAIGDVNDFPQFVYTSAVEGRVAVDNAFDYSNQIVDYSYLPWVIFTDPQVAGVGMDEQQAKDAGIPHEVTVLPLSDVPRSIVAMDTRGFIKLIRNPKTKTLLGARIVAKEGGELAMEISLAIKHEIPTSLLASSLHPYLTLSEGIRLAALSFTVNVKKMSCCAS